MAKPGDPPIPEDDKTGGLRRLALEGLEQYFTREYMNALLEGALAITKQVWVQCQHCKKMTKAEVNDSKAVVGALSEFVTKVADVPREQVQEQDRIVLERIVYMCPTGEHAEESAKDGD